jgi:hypothetical protein
MADGAAYSFRGFCTLQKEMLSLHQNVSPGLGVLWKTLKNSSQFNIEQADWGTRRTESITTSEDSATELPDKWLESGGIGASEWKPMEWD